MRCSRSSNAHVLCTKKLSLSVGIPVYQVFNREDERVGNFFVQQLQVRDWYI